MTIYDFVQSVLGGTDLNHEFIYYIICGSILLICIDAILSFIFGGISNLTRK